MPKLSGRRVKLWRGDQLLAQIGRRVDQEPVIAVSTDRNRSLGALQPSIGSRRRAYRTPAIPLRNAATCRGAQDDDPKHDPSPGEIKSFEGGHQRSHAPAPGTAP